MTDATAEPPRVLWLIKGLGPGGAENLLASSAEVVDPARFRYVVAYLRADKKHLVARLASHGVPARLLTEGSQGQVLWPVRLRTLMANADVVHAHSPLLAGVARLLRQTIGSSRRPALLSTEHNEWSSFARTTRFLNAVTSGLDDHRFAVSERVRMSMWSRAQRKTEVLVHGIVLAGAHRTATPPVTEMRDDLGLEVGAVIGITVANFRKEKDYPNLLRSARLVIDQSPHFHLLVVGQGPLRDEVHALHAELGLHGRVHLLGYREDVAALLPAADMFILGSAHEGLPVSIMEAMAAGLPIVATDVGGVAEAVKADVCGLIVPPRSPEALAEAVVSLVNDAELRGRMSAEARDRSSVFDIKTAVTRQEEAYGRLLAGGRQRSGLDSLGS